ncbi:helix-turn-helix transcriptional regulator [Streptosporangium roseum]|uniref:ATPase-like protein n=1 Tax=Streptosporangium roseum (strain ATCC 12428 / DSM 43021 / JCM 3005 / KCTC 9067 / NCIMB 10171 / NRRL 2505 / NI 9100) TaxID=479432 RepID=D2AY97_STRRD|nr:LuxR family transcriptional regulator [Streptosporangium roseum]ACZ87107.1 ATPase-like protein [Streptosporangium roseum DSM 43021]
MSADGRRGVGRTVSPVLVGRDAELARLAAAVAARPSVVVVEGEAGIGKSRLVAELAARPEMAGLRFLSGGCSQIREPFPLGPLVEALRSSGGDLAGVALSPVAGALRSLFPELADVLPGAPGPLDDRAAERHRLFRGLAAVLAALGPAVLVVEDLHWADEQTVEFLAYLLANPPGALSVVLTYRGEEAPAGVQALTARPADTIIHEHIALATLDETQTRALAAAILGSEEVSAEFAGHLCTRASGLPLAIQELLALLRSRGALIRWEGGWARRALDALDVPVGVRASVQERVGRLSPAARGVAEAAAALQLASPVAVLTGVTGLSPAEAADGVDEVLDSGLFVERDGVVRFRHVLAAQAVHEGISLGRRQALHAAAATAVRDLRPVPLGRVAYHLRQAGRLGDWVDAAESAADQAFALGDDAEVARLLEDVLRHADLAPEHRAALAIRLGWAASELLHLPDVGDLLAEALDKAPPGPVRGELRFLLGMQLEVTRTDPARRYRMFTDALEELAERPELAAWTMVALALPATMDVPSQERLGWLERALETLPEVGDPATRLLVLSKVAMVFTVVGDPRWAELTDRVVRETGGYAGPRREVSAYRSIGDEACFSGHHEVALRLLTKALESAASADVTGGMEFRCRASMTMVAYCRGTWDGLGEEVEALRHGRSDRPVEVNLLDAVAACLSPAPGRMDAAQDLLREVVQRVGAMGDVDLLPFPVSMLLRVATARGEAAAAIAGTSEAVALWEANSFWPVGVRAVPALVEALLAAGRPAEAAEVVVRYESRLLGLDAPLAPAGLRQARGLMAAAEQRWREAAEHFTAAAADFRRLPAPYEAAHADEQAAACLFALGDPAAEPTLKAAITVYGGMGARWDLDRATRLARRWGLRPAPPAPSRDGANDSLSARQQQVARLAAAGLTNQEIAREMFLSPKTVDKHLGAAMRKFGARSRTELARHLDHPAGP